MHVILIISLIAFEEKVLSQLHHITEKLNKVDTRLDSVQKTFSTHYRHEDILATYTYPETAPKLPVSSAKDVEALEAYLNEKDEHIAKLAKYLSAVGTSQVDRTTRLILQAIFTNVAAKDLNWAGTRGIKKGLKNTAFKQLLFRAVRLNEPTRSASDDEIATAIKSWLKYAPSRMRNNIPRDSSLSNSAQQSVCEMGSGEAEESEDPADIDSAWKALPLVVMDPQWDGTQ